MTFGENNFLAAGIHTAAVCSGHKINRLLLRQKTALAKITALIFPLANFPFQRYGTTSGQTRWKGILD